MKLGYTVQKAGDILFSGVDLRTNIEKTWAREYQRTYKEKLTPQ